MAYLFVVLALFFLTVKGYCGKKTGKYMQGVGDAFLFNLARIVLCIVVGLGVVLAEQAGTYLKIDGGMMAICLLAGAANAAFLVGWLLAVQRCAMVTVDVTLTMGSIIPAILCALLYQESLQWQKMIGFLLIVLAAFIMSGYNKNTKGNIGLAGVFYLIFAAVGDGMVSFCQQLYKHHDIAYPKSIYHFYTYVFAGVILFVFWRINRMVSKERISFKEEMKTLRTPFPYIVVIAVCLFAATYCQTIAASDYEMSSQILYPVIKGGCLITVNITAMLFFDEKATWRSVLGSLITLAGIGIMNV